MSISSTRDQFKNYCLRALGHPVIEINVSEEQIDDRVDEALKYYADYHFDATERIYFKHVITQIDVDNKYIILPENIIGAVDIFNISSGMSSGNMFDIRYQIALNDLYNLTSVSMVPYFMTMQHLQLIEQILIGKIPIRYSRHRNRLHIDASKEKLIVGQYLIVDAYEVIDPTEFSDVWGDRWLFRYCTALIKKQWGNNLKKFDGMEMPGGIKFNGQKIFDEADKEITQMEKEVILNFSPLVYDLIG